MSASGSQTDPPSGEDATLPGETPAALDASRPASEQDTLVADTGVAVVRADSPREDPPVIARYEILRRIGEGGMGLIYEARDPELERKVAIKLVRPALHNRRDDARSRLLREAQALAKITHPNVIHVYEVGTFEDQVFVAMEFVDGKTLRDWQWQPHVPWRAILDAYVAAGRGLGAAHARGLVHRDFKPDNVLLTADDKVRVIDFGLARGGGDTDGPPLASDAMELVEAATVDLSQPMTRLTKTGAILGTPAYMAPEQHRGLASDGRTDQFSFCVALYEALYGMRPFAGKTYPELVSRVLEGQVEDQPRFVEVPPFIRRALLRGLSVDPEARYPDMGALIDELRRDPRTRTRRRGVLVGVLALGTAGVGVWSSIESTRQLRRDRDALRAELDASQIEDLRGDLLAVARRAPAQAHNAFVLGRARDVVGKDASLSLAWLATLEDPDEPTTQAARLIAGDALARGVSTAGPDPATSADLLAVSGDGTRFAIAAGTQVTVWEGTARGDVISSPSRVTALAVGAADQPILIGREDGTVLFVGEQRSETKMHEHAITALALSGETNSMATADRSGEMAMWEIVDGQPTHVRRVARHDAPIRALAYSPSGAALASGGDDGKVVRWKLADKKHRSVEPGPMSITSLAWADESSIDVLGSDGTLNRWHSVGDRNETLARHVRAFAETESGLLAVDEAGTSVLGPAHYRDVRVGTDIEQLAALGADRFLTRDAAGRVRTWTIRPGGIRAFDGATSGAWLPAWSADGRTLAFATRSGALAVVEPETSAVRLSLEPVGDEILALALAPDAAHLAAVSADGGLHIAALGADHAAQPVEQKAYPRMAWAPDGSRLASFGCWKSCGVWLWNPDATEYGSAVIEFTEAAQLRFDEGGEWLYVDPGESLEPVLLETSSATATELVWDGARPPTRIAETWTDAYGLRVLGLDEQGRLGLWQRGGESGSMLRIRDQSVESVRADTTRRWALIGHADGSFTLWDLARETLDLVPPLPEETRPFVVSPDGRWLLAQAVDRSRPEDTLLHVPTGTTRTILELFPSATVSDRGTIADGDGERLRLWDSPAPTTWPVLREWIGRVTDARPDAPSRPPN